MSTLRTRSLLDLIPVFDQGRREILGFDGVRLRGVPVWELADRIGLNDTERRDWLATAGMASYYPADAGDVHVSVDLDPTDDPDLWRYRCPATFGLTTIRARDAAVLAVPESRFLNFVADLLNIPSALRTDISKALLDGALWRLGKARIDQAHLECWLARDVAASLHQIVEHFCNPALPDQGIVLFAGRALPPLIQSPRNYRFVLLADALSADSEMSKLDFDFLRRVLKTPHGGSLKPALAVELNDITRTLKIRGIAEPWPITGNDHWAAVKYMHDQFVAGRMRLTPGEVLNAVYNGRAQGRSKTLASLFRGNRHWKTFLQQPRKGEVCFAGL